MFCCFDQSKNIAPSIADSNAAGVAGLTSASLTTAPTSPAPGRPTDYPTVPGPTGNPTAIGHPTVPALAPAPGPTDSTGITATGGCPTGRTVPSTNQLIQSVELNQSRLLVTCLNRYAHML